MATGWLAGTAAPPELSANDGDDVLSGGAGDDPPRVGPGADRASCGRGDDTVSYPDRTDLVGRTCERVRFRFGGGRTEPTMAIQPPRGRALRFARGRPRARL